MEDNGWHFPQFTIMIQCYRGLCGGKVDYKIIQLCRCWSLELSVIIQSKHGQVNGPLRRRLGPGTQLFHYHHNNNAIRVWPRRGRGPGHTMLHHLERAEKTERRGVTGHSSLCVIIWGGDMSRAGIRDKCSQWCWLLGKCQCLSQFSCC